MVLDDEIWFERVLWSYVPCHWKGWLLLFVTAFPTATAIVVLMNLDRPKFSYLAIAIFVLALVWLMRTAKRHSRPKSGNS